MEMCGVIGTKGGIDVTRKKYEVWSEKRRKEGEFNLKSEQN